jgi:hypothetical protein
MNRVRKSEKFILFGLIFATLGLGVFFMGYANIPFESLQKPKEFEGAGSFRSARTHVMPPRSINPVNSVRTESPTTATSQVVEITEEINASDFPNETTIPPELLYLDDQPIDFDSVKVDKSPRKDEVEAQPTEEIDADLPNADTIPTELLELDNEPPMPE